MMDSLLLLSPLIVQVHIYAMTAEKEKLHNVYGFEGVTLVSVATETQKKHNPHTYNGGETHHLRRLWMVASV
jgi:hypothetical protein